MRIAIPGKLLHIQQQTFGTDSSKLLGVYSDFVPPSGVENETVLAEMNKFIEAHDRYLALDKACVYCSTPQQKELLRIELRRAYLEVQYRANKIAGLQYAEGMDFADMQ